MSWGRSAAGPPHHVIETAESWRAAVAASDRAMSVPESVAVQHQEQVDRCLRTVSEFAGSLPVGWHMTVSANGSAHVGSPATWNVNLGAYKPVPIE